MSKSLLPIYLTFLFCVATLLVVFFGLPQKKESKHFATVYLPTFSSATGAPEPIPTVTPTAEAEPMTSLMSPISAWIVPNTPVQTMPSYQMETLVETEVPTATVVAPTPTAEVQTVTEEPVQTHEFQQFVGVTPFFTFIPEIGNVTPEPTVIPEIVSEDPAYDTEYLLSYTLDEMWDTAEAMGLTKKVKICTGQPPVPFVTWEMASQAAGKQTSDRKHTEIKMQSEVISQIVTLGGASFPTYGVVQIEEEVVKAKLVNLYVQGNLHACLQNDRPTLYGHAIYEFLLWLQNYII